MSALPAPESEPTPAVATDPLPVTVTPVAEPATPEVVARVYFVRHALAGSRETWTGEDAERPLTEKGRRRAAKAGKGLRALVGTPDVVLTSPYARAQETAQLVAKGLRFRGEVQTNDHLVHGGRAEMIQQILLNHAGQKNIVLVGHSPDLERWIAALTVGPDAAPFLELKKGGVCRVDVTTLEPVPRGVLRWVVTPAILREL